MLTEGSRRGFGDGCSDTTRGTVTDSSGWAEAGSGDIMAEWSSAAM